MAELALISYRGPLGGQHNGSISDDHRVSPTRRTIQGDRRAGLLQGVRRDSVTDRRLSPFVGRVELFVWASDRLVAFAAWSASFGHAGHWSRAALAPIPHAL